MIYIYFDHEIPYFPQVSTVDIPPVRPRWTRKGAVLSCLRKADDQIFWWAEIPAGQIVPFFLMKGKKCFFVNQHLAFVVKMSQKKTSTSSVKIQKHVHFKPGAGARWILTGRSRTCCFWRPTRATYHLLGYSQHPFFFICSQPHV